MMEQGNLRPQAGVPFLFDIKKMQQYPHVGVFGGSGSGKSFGLRVMLEEVMKLRIPAIMFDPHFEMDFRKSHPELVERASATQERSMIVRVGHDVGVSFSDLSTRDFIDLLGAAGALSESMVNVIQMLHKRKDSYTTFTDRLGNLVEALEEGKQELQKQLKSGDCTPTEVNRIQDLLQLLQQYGTLPASSVKGVHWRLRRLDRAGLFGQDILAITRGVEQGKLVVVQGDAWILQVFTTYVIGTLYRKRREYKDARSHGEEADFFPPFLIVTDEAHNFAPKGIDLPAKSIIKEIAQEGRKYGVFLFLATQRPTLLDETITAQLNTKFVFRTVRGTDIATLREETDLTPEEGKRLPYLRSGDTFVSSAILGRTIFIRIRAAYTESPHVENPFDELAQIIQKRETAFLQVIQDLFPLSDTDLMKAVRKIQQETDLDWDVPRLKEELDRLAQDQIISKQVTPFAVQYDQMTKG